MSGRALHDGAAALHAWTLALLVLFAACLGVEHPAPPMPGHAQWCDLVMLAAASTFGAARLAGHPPASRSIVASASIAALLVWAAVSAWANGVGGWKCLGWIELACVFAVTSSVAQGPRARDRILRGWIVGATGLAAVGLLGAALSTAGIATAFGDPRGGNLGVPFRPVGVCASSNLLASILLVPVLLLTIDGPRLVGRKARRVLLPLLLATLALTMSRSWLGLGVAWLAAQAMRSRARPWHLVGLACATAALVASCRLHIRHDEAGWSFGTKPGIRWRVMAGALETALRHPLVGLGPSALPSVASWEIGGPMRRWAAHCTPLDLAATLGIPALVAWCALVADVGRAAWRAPRSPTRIALLAGLAGTLFDAFALDVEDFRHVWLLLGLLAAQSASRPVEGPADGPSPRPRRSALSSDPAACDGRHGAAEATT